MSRPSIVAGPPGQTRPDGTPVRTEAFDDLVEEIRRRYGSDIPVPLPRLEDRVRRRLGFAPLSATASALSGVLGVGLRLGVALLVTALVGGWAAIPWSRWVPILAFYGLLDATQPLRMPPLDVLPGARIRRAVEDYLALLPTIVRESDLRDLADFARRWIRLPVIAAMGVVVVATVLLASWWSAPAALAELPPGSIVLLSLLLYDFGAVTVGAALVELAFRAREARYDHHLFWPSPADSPEVQTSVRWVNVLGFATGMWITFYLLLALVLVGWGSPLMLPVAVGFVVIGYLTTIGQVFGVRASIARIVCRARDQRLQGLRHRIDAFGPRATALSPQEHEQLAHLLDLHDRVRDAPATPSTTHTALHTAVGLILPTLLFVVTVFGEVSAERFLDAILP